MDIHEGDADLDLHHLALRKFPRYGPEPYTSQHSFSASSPAHSSSPITPGGQVPSPAGDGASQPGMQFVLPPNIFGFPGHVGPRNLNHPAAGSPDKGKGEGFNAEHIGKCSDAYPTTVGVADKEGGHSTGSIGKENSVSSLTPNAEESTRPATSDNHRVIEPATYIFSPAFSTHGRKNTLIRRMFHKPDATEMPDEIVVGRSSACPGGYVTYKRSEDAMRKEIQQQQDHSDASGEDSSDDEGSQDLREKNSPTEEYPMKDKAKVEGEGPEPAKAKEEVQQYIHLLHYPGSQHSDHARTLKTKKKENIIGKLFHFKGSEERGRQRERTKPILHSMNMDSPQSSGTSPFGSPIISPVSNSTLPDHDLSPSFIPVSVDNKDLITTSRSISPSRTATPAGILSFLHVVGSRGRSESSVRSSVVETPPAHNGHLPIEDHAQGGLFKDMITTKRRRAASSARASDVSDTDVIGASGLSRKSSTKQLQRSPSDTSMAEKYGKISKTQVLGKGANAVVRLAHKKDATSPSHAEQLYAVKEFRKLRKNETQREYIKKLIAEFCISSNMHHENVIQTVDLIQDERERWCQVMEYMPGGDLYTLISSGELHEADEKLCLFKQLVKGVEYLHSMGVAHRDLKPENLLLDADTRILKITDFGVSEVFRTCFEKAPRKAVGVCGSEPYIAPEEWDSPGGYDATKADIWACGIILYTLLQASIPWRIARAPDPHYTKYAAFGASNPGATQGFGAFDRTQPPGPRPIIYRMLAPDPQVRITAAEILAHSWFTRVECCTAGAFKHKHGSKA